MNQLSALFPATVSCVYSNHPPENTELLAAENDAAAKMRAGRLREFAHGRACARRALHELGIRPCPIPVGDSRAPVWPDRVVGSISHCGSHAAAVVAFRSEVQGLGVDLELRESLDRPLLTMVCRAEELRCLESSDTGIILDKLFFSAKESLFKCVWPELQQFIDFQEIEILLNLAENTYTAVSHSPQLPDALINRIRGRYVQTSELIITAAYLP
jgi:4'-phosphopantetheinyl transferase EntD